MDHESFEKASESSSETQAFEMLEKRIGDTLGLIRTLRDENQQLVVRRDELQTRLDEADAKTAGLEQELNSLRGNTVSSQKYEERRKEIEGRLAGLLQRFEELDRVEAEQGA